MLFKRFKTLVTIFVMVLTLSATTFVLAAPPATVGLLNPKTVPKYINQLVANIPIYESTNITDPTTGQLIRQDYTVDMTHFREQILPTGTVLVGSPDGKTTVWGYAGQAKDATTGTSLGYFENSPSATFLATSGVPSQVKWVNNIDVPQFLPVDPTIHWADPNNIPMNMPNVPANLLPPYPLYPPGFDGTVTATNPKGYNAQYPVPLVPHLHGAEVQSYSDGGPNAWFTFNGIHGSTYSTVAPTDSNAAVYYYPNAQNPTTLWYHDHALGMTRLNVCQA